MDVVKVAEQIVARYFLKPYETIKEIHDYGETIEVCTNIGKWSLIRRDRRNDYVEPHGYDLYDVGILLGGLKPGLPGVAVLQDGRIFKLDNADEFRAFFLAARQVIEPLELAYRIAAYQSSDGS